MSPHAVNSLVSDLVSMAKAVEELPLVQEALEKSQHEARDYADLVHNREAEIASLRKQIQDMSSHIHTAEVARDDAELRFLELEDRAIKAASAFKVAIEAMDVADALADDMTMKPAIEPAPTPANDPSPMQVEGEAHRQPEADALTNPVPLTDTKLVGETGETGHGDATQGQSATDPTANPGSPHIEPRVASSPSVHSPESAAIPSSEGVSVPTDPSHASIPTGETNASVPGTASGDAYAASDPSKPYLGKLYRDVPGYVSFAAWINGGGREGDYYIR